MDKYVRNFVMLNECDNKYRNDVRKSVSGYTKIEIKNSRLKVMTHVQNLKILEDGNYIYKVYLIGKHAGRLFKINAGILSLDTNGRGECTFETKASDVKNTGQDIQNIKAIAVVAKQAGDTSDKDLICCLEGYIDKTFDADWKTVLLQNKRGIKKHETIGHAAKQQSDVPVSEQKMQQDNKKQQGHMQSKVDIPKEQQQSDDSLNMSGNKSQRQEQFKQVEKTGHKQQFYPDIDELFNIVNKGVTDKAKHDNAKLAKTDKQNVKDEHKQKDFLKYGQEKSRGYEEYTGFWSKLENYFIDLFAYYERTDIFDEQLEGYDWRKIDLMSIGFDGIYSIVPVWYYMYNNNLGRYKHYILGIAYKDKKVKYIVYGLPGRKCRQEQPYEGMTGYVYWHPVKKCNKDKQDAFGYWLLHIDAETGRVVCPLGVTKV